MRILGIDYGRKKIGLALGDSATKLVEPHRVIRVKSEEKIWEEIKKVIEQEKVRQVVVGISESKMAEETKEFGKQLGEKLKMQIAFCDETLSSRKARELAIEAGMKRKKRKRLEDAYSASLILQAYLDEFAS